MTRQNFKVMPYQTAAVHAVVECFAGQPHQSGFRYRMDPGRSATTQAAMEFDQGHRNPELALDHAAILANIQKQQRAQNLNQSAALVSNAVCPINLDVEMETGTGKTYCYIKTMFEMNKRYGWAKFIVVVPSIAIREGVAKTFDDTGEHFLADYGKRARFFIYNSRQLSKVEGFSSGDGINVMIINIQAFNSNGAEQRRMFMELDDFQSRRPIDVISATRPFLILDEPQKMEGSKTQSSLAHFKAMAVLRYSATHKTQHNLVHRLDALDAYNQRLVKKIAVRGISVRGLPGTSAYLYLEGIEVSNTKPPEARLEIEIRQKDKITRKLRKVSTGTNLFTLSEGLEQYRDRFVVTDINAITDTIEFENGIRVSSGEAVNDTSELSLRRIQIREAITAHFTKERALFDKGIKVLSLFFIDAVANYRVYDEAGVAQNGDYAKIFEEEYAGILEAQGLLEDSAYHRHLKSVGMNAAAVHNGYFSIDKKKRLVDPDIAARGETAGESNDADAYDLILKDKARLLSLEEPVRFLFSHSALREGWDNPNVFVICTLKHSDNQIGRRQEVGRGLRICVDNHGNRQDNLATVHDINVLTVVANESYENFVKAFQKELRDSLTSRPAKASEEYFTNKVLKVGDDEVPMTSAMAKALEKYLTKNDYSDDDDRITDTYHAAKREGTLAELPEVLKPYQDAVIALVDSVYSDAAAPAIGNDRKNQVNRLNDNFHKQEFQRLWNKINKKAVYLVEFETAELVAKCIKALDAELKVTPLQYIVRAGEQDDRLDYDDVQGGGGFGLRETQTAFEHAPVPSGVRFDLIGKVASLTHLTRRTVGAILGGINVARFSLYKLNPEAFISEVARLISEQKATMIVQHLRYNMLSDTFSSDVFTQDKQSIDVSSAVCVKNHVYDFVVTDSKGEREFARNLDTSTDVIVYAKLPKGFFIPTPLGDYNPDWAIAFKDNGIKHVYFVAETKGTMSTLQLREIEKAKIECAREFFKELISADVKYDVIDSYERLIDVVKAA